jgi:hypothetical protein
MSRRSRKAPPVTVHYADGRTEIREASSLQKRAIVARGHGGRVALASVRSQRRRVSIALAQSRMLDRQWQEAESRDEGLRGDNAT